MMLVFFPLRVWSLNQWLQHSPGVIQKHRIISDPTPHLLNQNLHFNEIPKRFIYVTRKFEMHQFNRFIGHQRGKDLGKRLT